MKKIISFVLVMLISCTVYANEFITVEKCSSNVNGEFYANIHSWHYPFLCYNDVTYAPVDTFAQSFGNDAEFNERTNTYNLTKSVFDGSVKFGQTKPAIHVSFKELLKNPQKYIGKHVSVEGYLRVAFEEDNLFLTYDDYKYFNTNNSISLNFRTILLRALNASIGDLSTISGRYVTIQGVFKQLWEYPERYMLSHINYVEAKGKGTRLQKYENFTEYDEGDYKAEICEAKLWLDKAINEAPYLRDPYIERALLEYQLKNWKEVEFYCQEALKIKEHQKTYINEIFSWNNTVYDLLSLSYYYQNNFEEAIKYVKTAIEMEPNNERLQNNLKLIEEKLNNKNAQ